jgi:carboxylesterase type B
MLATGANRHPLELGSKTVPLMQQQISVVKLMSKYGVTSGEFPNHTLGPCCPNAEGAWHGYELGLIFGTTESRGQGKDTENEKKLAIKLREAWSTFAKDPVSGLERLGWPVYDPNSKLSG